MRVYLCGAVDKLPDLGVGWRREVEDELVAAGLTAVWPVGLKDIHTKEDEERVRAHWADPIGRRYLGSADLTVLTSSDIVFARRSKNCGKGTFAELAVCDWLGIPVVGWVVPGGSVTSVFASENYVCLKAAINAIAKRLAEEN